MTQEISIALVLILLAGVLSNPFGLWMPPMLVMSIVVLLIAAFAAFAAFIWQERPRDEREGLHRLIAARFAFLSGTAVLVIAIAVESIRHTLDLWLPFALVIMVLAKIVGLSYGRRRH